MGTQQQNTMWQCRVRQMLEQGFGAEDIADKDGCPVEDVRKEIEILRAEGYLEHIYSKPIKWGPTAQKLMVKK